uniref:FLYWCH-type domain-containing protein n=1 Tax=Panagrolaimus superbus TaxID=310955 RepID=A0A914YMF4_9BILA
MNESFDSLHDVDDIPTYGAGDRIRIQMKLNKKPIAIVGGYEFKWAHEAQRTGEHYWLCVNYFKKGVARCPAVIYTDGKTSVAIVVAMKNSHNHAGDAVSSENRIMRNRGRHLASTNGNLSTRRVIAQVTEHASDAIRSRGTVNMERLIRRHRQRERFEPPVPRTAEFVIPEEYKTMSDGSPFVMHDSSVDNRENVEIDGRIIILGIEYWR